jgi:hypothetical protein
MPFSRLSDTLPVSFDLSAIACLVGYITRFSMPKRTFNSQADVFADYSFSAPKKPRKYLKRERSFSGENFILMEK